MKEFIQDVIYRLYESGTLTAILAFALIIVGVVLPAYFAERKAKRGE